MSNSYVSQKDFNDMKQRFNTLVNYTINLQKYYDEVIAKLKEKIAASTSTSTSSNQKVVNASVSQLNDLVDYLENWADAGNLSMSDIRESVGGKISTK